MKRKYFRKSPELPVVDEAGEATVETTLEEAAVETDEAPVAKTPLLRRVAYKTLYAVSYGAVFSSLLLQKLLVPKDTVIEVALHDGAVAARHDFEEKEHLVAEVIRETEEILSPDEPPAVPA